MISAEEYAALPASIQKKFFSSKERLCIAQQLAARGRGNQHGKLGSWLSSTSTSDLQAARPSTSGGLHSLKPKSRAHDPKLFLIRFDEESVSDEEARWFLSLPEKVKTKRFSREELVSLTAISHRVLSKSAAECGRKASQRRRSVHRLEASACTPIGTAFSSSATSMTESNNLEISSPDGTEQQAQASVPQPRRIPTDVVEISKIKHNLHDELPAETDQAVETAVDAADAEMEILKLYLQRRSLKPKALASKTKRSPPRSPPTGLHQPTKRQSSHRLPMLTPLPLPPPVLAPVPRPQTNTPFSTSARLSRPFLNTDPLVLDSSDARMDSAQPDEGVHALNATPPPVLQIEGEMFELPANEDPPPITRDEDCPYPRLVSAFSDDDTEGDVDEDDDNLDAESVETIGPRTPSPMENRGSAVPQATGDSGVDIPELHLDARPKTSSVLDRASASLSNYGSNHSSIGSHAQVLRTSSEEILYAYQRRLTSVVDVETSDPLALGALPVCDDETGAHGAFAVSHSHDTSTLAPTKGLRRVLKSFRRL